MLYSLFKAQVCAYLNRKESDLLVNGIDLVLESTNKARKQAQKLLDFEKLRCSVDLTINLTSGVDVSTAVLSGGFESIRVNRIERATLVLANGEVRPIDLTTRSTMVKRYGRLWDSQRGWIENRNGQLGSIQLPSEPTLVRHGDNLKLWPTGSTVFSGLSAVVALDVTRWADNYIDDFTRVTIEISAGTLGPIFNPGLYEFLHVGTYHQYNTNFATYSFFETNTFLGHAYIWFDEGQNNWVISNELGNATNCWVATTKGVKSIYTTGWTPYVFGGNQTGCNTTSSDIGGVAQEDFFLEDCEEWLMFFVLRQLEYYNKQDERFVISQKMLDDSWTAVVSWNNSISDSGSAQDYDLD